MKPKEEDKYGLLVENLTEAFAYHQVITDGDANPVDYVFLDVSPAFVEMTGLSREKVIGRKCTDVLPGIEDSGFDWIGTFGQVAITGEPARFESYSEPLARWYEVTAYSDSPGYFVTLFRDITSQKQEKISLEALSHLAEKCLQFPMGELDYQAITDELLSFSGAKFTGFNIYTKDGNKTITMAISGIATGVRRAVEILGFELIGKEWAIIPERMHTIKGGSLHRYNDLNGAVFGVIPKQVALLLQKMFRLGDVFVIVLIHSGRTIGDFIFFMGADEELQNPRIVELYANQVGLALARSQVEAALQRSHSLLAAALEATADGILIVNRVGEVISFNRRFLELWRMPQNMSKSLNEKQLLDIVLNQLLHPDVFLDKVRALYQTPGLNSMDELVFRDGRVFERYSQPQRIGDAIVGRVWSFRDITERKQAEEALLKSEKKLKAAFESSHDAITITSKDGKFIDCNQRALDLYGLSSKELFLGKRPADFSPPTQPDGRDSQEASRKYIQEALGKEGFVRFEWLHQREDGGTFPAEVILTAYELGEALVLQANIRDITERKRNEEKLRYVSMHDALTGLYNRSFFEEEMRRLNGSREYPLTIIVADIDGLKLINDTMGHASGDSLLKACAAVLQKSLRGYDILARIGGDEFAVLLPRSDERSGKKIIKRIRVFCEEYNREHNELPLHISMGAATAQGETALLEDVLKKADDLMYRDKRERKNSVRIRTVDMLMTTLNKRDYLAAGHGERIGSLSMQVGEKLNLSRKQLENLSLLARVHDLGKVGVPAELLFKKDALAKEEWEVMRQHAEKGYRIAFSSPHLAAVADLILKHHEHWDGRGYPQGLKGEEIPLECRIFAVAEAFDVMTSKRPYGKTKSTEEAIGELKRCAGTQFDPNVVDVFLSFDYAQ
jgi:diguanylate cyclase (GGDEF)-like protein/PAS domain S-box-containing protein